MDIIILDIKILEYKVKDCVEFCLRIKSISPYQSTIRKFKIWKRFEDFVQLRRTLCNLIQEEKKDIFLPDLWVKKSFWIGSQDPRLIEQQCELLKVFIAAVQSSVFLLRTIALRLFCQGHILVNCEKGHKQRNFCSLSFGRVRINSAFEIITHSDFAPLQRDWNKYKKKTEVAGGILIEESVRFDFEFLSDDDLTLLLSKNIV